MQSDDFSHLALGKTLPYVEQYEPGLLQPIARALSRQNLPSQAFSGEDIWTAYELSWLDEGGKPQVAIAEFSVPAESDNIIESKSFKYYLNSFNQSKFTSAEAVKEILRRDLTAAAGADVAVKLYALAEFAKKRATAPLLGRPLDTIELPATQMASQPDGALLQLQAQAFEGVWYSHLLKSNCPVTGQPDWASIWCGWQGSALEPSSLLAYLVSYRSHQDFHENCVERIYCDLLQVLQPAYLWVYARYTRRGGLDINPFRSSQPMSVPAVFGERQ